MKAFVIQGLGGILKSYLRTATSLNTNFSNMYVFLLAILYLHYVSETAAVL